MKSLRFFDDNTQSWWVPVTGGANVPALNELFAPFGVAFGDSVLRGELSVGGSTVQLASAAPILRFPSSGWLVRAQSLQDEGAKIYGALPFMRMRRDVPMLGLLQPRASGAGRIVAFGDSECLDSLSAQQGNTPCWWLLEAFLAYACDGERDRTLFPDHLRLEVSQGQDQPLPNRPPTAGRAHGDTRSAAADDADPSACLLSRLGLNAAQPPLGLAEWSSLPDEPFGVLAHWPHAAAEPFLPDLSATEFAMGGSVGSTVGSTVGGVLLNRGAAINEGAISLGGFGAAHLFATRAASGLLVLCTIAAALAFVLMRFRVCRRGGRMPRSARDHRLASKTAAKGRQARANASDVSSQHVHTV